VLWDKTGTLTRGLIRIEEIRPLGSLAEPQCLELAVALEQASEHPIAKAFAASAAGVEAARDVQVFSGEGLEGAVAGRRLRIGSPAFVANLGPGTALPEGLAGESWVCLGDASGLLAAFRLTDQQRPEAGHCVAQLAALGLESEIVSGDEASAVERVAVRSGISSHSARLSPDSKLARLKELQAGGAVVVAVGDGINDAPLLRGADVAVAMGRGSALAQTSADMILVRDSLDELPPTVQLARRAQRVVRQNLAWSIVYNLAALPAAALGFVPPWLAAIGMSLSSIAVVLNASRLSRTPGRRSGHEWSLPRPAETA
jgi:Cu2+-exporting ATPase